MVSIADCSWFICTLSKESFKNWEICKEISAWGIAGTGDRKPNLDRVQTGDHLIIYAASRGLVATAICSGSMKRPQNKADAPWAGGIYRYGAIVPFTILTELAEPLKIPFKNMMFEGTSIHSSRLQKGFSMISTVDGMYLMSQIDKAKKLK